MKPFDTLKMVGGVCGGVERLSRAMAVAQCCVWCVQAIFINLLTAKLMDRLLWWPLSQVAPGKTPDPFRPTLLPCKGASMLPCKATELLFSLKADGLCCQGVYNGQQPGVHPKQYHLWRHQVSDFQNAATRWEFQGSLEGDTRRYEGTSSRFRVDTCSHIDRCSVASNN